MASSKGNFVVSEKFGIIMIILMMLLVIAIWLLLNSTFMNYIIDNINSQQKFCEAFEQVPLIGTIQCPK